MLRTSRWIVVPIGTLLASVTVVSSSLAATPPPGPRAPSVNTSPTPLVTTTSVTFSGGVNPHGLAAVYAFQFGTTPDYGAQTATTPVGNGTTEVKVSQTMTGLAPGTTYHYRLVAASAAGTTNGHNYTFTTKSTPLTFKLTAIPKPVVFGGSFSIRGMALGTKAADRKLALQSNPFPYLDGFKDTGATTLTDAVGNFSFHVTNLMGNTQFRVVTLPAPGTPAAPAAPAQGVKSDVIVEQVAVRVSLNLRSTGRPGFVRMYGTVAPAETGARVTFQSIRQGAHPTTVASAALKPVRGGESRFSHIVRIRRDGLYRALVQPLGGKHVSGHSRTVLIR